MLFTGDPLDIVSEEVLTESVSWMGCAKQNAISDRHEVGSKIDGHATSDRTTSRSLLQNENSGTVSHTCQTAESSLKSEHRWRMSAVPGRDFDDAG